MAPREPTDQAPCPVGVGADGTEDGDGLRAGNGPASTRIAKPSVAMGSPSGAAGSLVSDCPPRPWELRRRLRERLAATPQIP
eukprot:14924705-Alexandrium_andersonii.AAC.1